MGNEISETRQAPRSTPTTPAKAQAATGKTLATAKQAATKPVEERTPRPWEVNGVFTKLAGAPHFTVAVIDTFTEAHVDFDGDGKNDLAHGIVVGNHLRDENPFVTPVPIEINNNPQIFRQKSTEPDFRKRLALNAQYYTEAFQKVGDRIRSGAETHGTVMSMSPPLVSEKVGPDNTSQEVQTETKLSDLTQLMGEPITPENIREKKEAIRSKLLALSGRVSETDLPLQDYKFGLIGREIQSIEENITQNPKGKIPLYLSPGNSPEVVNLFSFARGAKTVGSTEAKGTPFLTSPTYTLVDTYAQGHFNVMPLQDKDGKTLGYDVNGDSQLDIPADRLSGNGDFISPFVNGFAGKRQEEVLATEKDWQETARILRENPGKAVKLPEGVFQKLIPYEPFLQAVGRDKQDIKRRLQLKGDFLTMPPTLFFRAESNGVLYYDPDNSGRKNAIWEHSGTSYAAPRALGRDLLKGEETFSKILAP